MPKKKPTKIIKKITKKKGKGNVTQIVNVYTGKRSSKPKQPSQPKPLSASEILFASLLNKQQQPISSSIYDPKTTMVTQPAKTSTFLTQTETIPVSTFSTQTEKRLINQTTSLYKQKPKSTMPFPKPKPNPISSESEATDRTTNIFSGKRPDIFKSFNPTYSDTETEVEGYNPIIAKRTNLENIYKPSPALEPPKIETPVEKSLGDATLQPETIAPPNQQEVIEIEVNPRKPKFIIKPGEPRIIQSQPAITQPIKRTKTLSQMNKVELVEVYRKRLGEDPKPGFTKKDLYEILK